MKTLINNLNKKNMRLVFVSSALLLITLVTSCSNRFNGPAFELAADAVEQIAIEERFFSSDNLDIKLNSIDWTCTESEFLENTFNSCTFYLDYQFGDKGKEFATVAVDDLFGAGSANYYSTIGELNDLRKENLDSFDQLKELGLLISEYGSGKLSRGQLNDLQDKING